MKPVEIVETTTRYADCCDGGRIFGHPHIYLYIGDEGKAVCPYCSRCFVLKEGHFLKEKAS
jgi:uncharacterized Zn-finger protein